MNGLSLNRIGKICGVSGQSVLNWIYNFAAKHAERPKPEGQTVILELDELWHFLQTEMLIQTNHETHHMEWINCRLLHWFGRFNRKSLIVSKSVHMVDVTLALFATFWVNGSHDHLLSLLN